MNQSFISRMRHLTILVLALVTLARGAVTAASFEVDVEDSDLGDSIYECLISEGEPRTLKNLHDLPHCPIVAPASIDHRPKEPGRTWPDASLGRERRPDRSVSRAPRDSADPY